MQEITDHPDVRSALRTGCPTFTAPENADTPEERRSFAEDAFSDFLSFALDGDPELLDNFISHYRWRYDAWLN